MNATTVFATTETAPARVAWVYVEGVGWSAVLPDRRIAYVRPSAKHPGQWLLRVVRKPGQRIADFYAVKPSAEECKRVAEHQGARGAEGCVVLRFSLSTGRDRPCAPFVPPPRPPAEGLSPRPPRSTEPSPANPADRSGGASGDWRALVNKPVHPESADFYSTMPRMVSCPECKTADERLAEPAARVA